MDKERTQFIADTLLKPILTIIDLALSADMDLASDCDSLVKSLGETLSRAQAVSGLMLDMSDVDKRAIEFQTFKAFMKLVTVRKKQQDETVAIADGDAKAKAGMQQIKNAMGF